MDDIRGKELGWDEEVEKGEEFTLLEPGDYDFTIETFERGRYEGSDKVPPCNRALLKVLATNGKDSTVISESLLLYDKMQWKLAEFFLSIGAEELEGRVRMNWNMVPQATGRATIEVRTDPKDSSKKYNHVKKWLPKKKKDYKAGAF